MSARTRRLAASRLQRTAMNVSVQIWACVFFPAYLLLLGPKGYVKMSLFKTTLLFALTLGLVLTVIVSFLVCLSRASKRRRKLRIVDRRRLLDPAVLAALGYLLFVWISTAFSPYREALYSTVTHEHALTLTCYVVCFLVLSLFAKPTRSVLIAIYAATGVHCLIVALQLCGWNLFGLYGEAKNYYISSLRHAGNFLGTVGNVDLVSALLSLLMPICLVGGLTAPGWRKLPGLVLAGICMMELLWIQVLNGLVGSLVGGVIAALALIPVRRKVKLVMLLVLAACCAAGAALVWARDFPSGPLHELHEILHLRIKDSFGSGRVFIWRQMLRRVPGQLFLGAGPDTVRYTGLAPFLRYNAAGKVVAGAALTDAHCLPLEILYCTGLFSLLNWLVMVFRVLRSWARRGLGSREGAAIGAGLVCFLVSMLFCISSVILMPLCWCLLGLLQAEQPPRRSESAQRPVSFEKEG